MTMDIHQRSLRAEVTPPFLPQEKVPSTPSPTPVTELPSAPQKPAKRSFDVAFLMAPDDLSTKKRQQQQQQLRMVSSASMLQRFSPPEVTFAHTAEAMELKISRSLNHQRILSGRTVSDFPPNPISPLGLLIPSPRDFQKADSDSKDSIVDVSQEEQLQFAKSAFTKVKSIKGEFNKPNKSVSPSSVSSTVSGGGMSPDMSYQESLSPPIMNSNSRSPVQYQQPQKFMNPNMAYFAAAGKTMPPMTANHFFYGQPPKDKVDGKQQPSVDANGFLGNFINKAPTDPMQKLRPMMYQNDSIPYPGLPVAAYPFPTNFPPAGTPVPTHTLLTAAASVTAALLPPSLAALTLPAQNVCAKCKISFRMTSDLVYHMRSHHKGEHVTVDAARRRREQDKLRCPVCNETFRERHHLTRHMTAHQDKEGDNDDEEDSAEISRRRSHQGLLNPQHK